MEIKVIYINISDEGKIDHCIAELCYPESEDNEKLERDYEYSYIKNGLGLCHWCKRNKSWHFAVPSKEIPDALRAFILLMGV